MADQKDGRSHNQPSHEAQVKGGEHSHGGHSESTQPQQGQGKHQPPNQEEAAKGGRHSQGER
jgi:hypothetical protein